MPDASVRYRETRPGEIQEAVMFTMAGGEAIDVESVRHDLSHTATFGGEVVGGAVMCLDADMQQAVVVHVADAEVKTSEATDAEEKNPTEAAATDDTPIDEDASSVDTFDAGVTGRRLLDLTLMKLRHAGERTTRLRAESALAERLWAHAEWLEHLPDLTEHAEARRWRDGLNAARPDAAAVVEAAWAKASAALAKLRETVDDAAPVPADDAGTSEKPDDNELPSDPGCAAQPASGDA